MQMRFDGKIGFPGGFVDPRDNTLEEGLNRELGEELGWDGKGLQITEVDYASSHATEALPQKVVAHFFTKRISVEELRKVEMCAVQAKDHGREITCNTRGNNTPPSRMPIMLFYLPSIPSLTLGSLITWLYFYSQRLKTAAPVVMTKKIWTKERWECLQDCFESVDWTLFRIWMSMLQLLQTSLKLEWMRFAYKDLLYIPKPKAVPKDEPAGVLFVEG
ncbi:U8 snoRNA-decapping enzyme isoform X2 [Hypanus sabinus]|nr:U8 snoRNA-decapping enzyme isoform X2 [Hypanus sabinus]